MEKTSFLSNLWERRVPQTVGLYIAATWMAIEIGDWVIERFLLAPEITSFIFIAMISFLPSVILMAYQYGKKGTDPWHKSTFALVPLNLLIACTLPIVLVQPVKASEVKTLVDETGSAQEFVVPKQQYLKQVITFFWQADNLTDEDKWLQFAAPWLLSKDLARNEFISSLTAFEHPHLFNIISEAGYQKGVGEPLALQLEATRSHSREFFLTGSIGKDGGRYLLTAQLYRSKDGKLAESFSESNDDLFKAIDKLSETITSQLIGFAARERLNNDLPVAEHVIANPEALKLSTKAMVQKLQSPYQTDYITDLEAAYALDNTSLEIQKLLFAAYAGAAKTSLAKEYGEKALAQSFKMTREERFQYQGYLYGMAGDQESHLKILTMWVELYPNSVEAHKNLARYQQAYSADLKVAEQSLLKVVTLLPEDIGAYYQLSKLYETMGDLDQAIIYMKKAVEVSSNDTTGELYLAQLYEKQGQFEKAKDVYEKVVLLEPNNTSANYFLALNNYKIGRFQKAKSAINSQLEDKALPLNQKASFVNLINRVSISSGQIEEALSRLEELNQDFQDLPSASKLRATILPRLSLLSKVGKFDKQEQEISSLLSDFDPPYRYAVDFLMLSVYKGENNIQGIEQFINKYEAINEQESTRYVENILDHAYLNLFELTGDYAKAKDKAYIIAERERKSSNSITDAFSYLSRRIHLARLYRLNELNAESESILKEVLKEFPAAVLAKKELVALYIKTNRLEEAQKLDSEIMNIWSNADSEYVEFKEYLAIRQPLKSIF